jgi:phenylpyruvate tautomerase PptA (4-oxalocrotonate tautomerase family)
MPSVRVETNQSADPTTSAAIILAITDLVAKVKPEVERRGIAVTLHHGCPLGFGGDASTPAVVITLTNAQMPHEVTLPLTQGLTAITAQHYHADPARIYVFFHELGAYHLVGIMGVTFVEIVAAQKPAPSPAPAAPPSAPPKG